MRRFIRPVSRFAFAWGPGKVQEGGSQDVKFMLWTLARIWPGERLAMGVAEVRLSGERVRRQTISAFFCTFRLTLVNMCVNMHI